MNYIVLGSLSMSVVGLLMIYVAAANMEHEHFEIDGISSELVGRTISTEGYIKSKSSHENGHMFLTLTDGRSDLQVPVFSSVMQHLDYNKFKRNSKVQVTGTVDEYRGGLQVIPRSHSDIKLD